MRGYDQKDVEVAVQCALGEVGESIAMQHLPAIKVDHPPAHVEYDHDVSSKCCVGQDTTYRSQAIVKIIGLYINEIVV